ncbi:MAG: GNAT family N-acetyltransferase [Saccharofermentanales bacterium]
MLNCRTETGKYTKRHVRQGTGSGFVYTSPYFRGKGYASSILAQLSQMALDKGFKKCALYTDLSNPTSNSIYTKIGDVPVCDSLVLKFE